MADDGETIVERVDFTWDGTTLCEQTTTSEDLPNPVTITWDHQGLRPLTQTERITPLRFPGQYYDPETGLHYNYFRHYDPDAARYLTHDPLGLTPAPNPTAYVHNPHTWTDPLGLSPCSRSAWAEKADFSSQKVMSKKFHAHASDFLDAPGNLNKANLNRFEESMREHMTDSDTKVYRFNYRNQGPAIGFIDPASQKMVMLHSDGRFWSAWKLGDKQFQGIVDKGFLW
nr:RHS repeat-associated core domain-containing protein [Streptomyces sp. SP2-10]